MSSINIAVVEYINTLPFLHGLSMHFHAAALHIIAANPANCARLYDEGKVDIALVPVGALASLKDYKIITNYCIGSNGKVDTVALLSQHPLDEIKTISLDSHSRTSANLIQILCNEYWHIEPNYISDLEADGNIASRLVIGDKVKELEIDYKYKYDLGEAWSKFTNKPMVFAVWIARPVIKHGLIDEINAAFRYAIKTLDSIPLNGKSNSEYWRNYLRHSIHYTFDELEREGMELFIEKSKQLSR